MTNQSNQGCIVNKPTYRLSNVAVIPAGYVEGSNNLILTGRVYGHPEYRDGAEIATTVLKGFDQAKAMFITHDANYIVITKD